MVTLALTPGCPAGIGPELFPLAIAAAALPVGARFMWCGSAGHLMRCAGMREVKAERNGHLVLIHGRFGPQMVYCTKEDSDDPALLVTPGAPPDGNALVAQKQALLEAIKLAQSGKLTGIVTGPIRKAALKDVEGKSFAGQTELLHHYLKSDDDPPLMCFYGPTFALGLATIHVPIKRVSEEITADKIYKLTMRLRDAASDLCETPSGDIRIVVLGLNPHAGEGGLIGTEEQDIIIPAIQRLQSEGLHVEGPVPADGFFGNLHRVHKDKWPHAVLAMMHDQGLAPYKLVAGGRVANITFGLTVPRTSPAHGTADDIVGTGTADADSLTEAICLASLLGLHKESARLHKLFHP